MLQDLRYGIRMLAKNRGFTIAALLILALGIGATTAIFSVVNAMLLRPLPYRDSDRIVWLMESAPRQGLEFKAISSPNFADWRDRNEVFELIGAFRERGYTVSDVDEPERVQGAAVSADTLRVLDVRPLLGRIFLPEEDRPGGNPVVILSYSLWRRSFGAASDIINQAITINGQSRVVVGVMPPNFRFPNNQGEVWIPLALDASRESRDVHTLMALARLKPGVAVEQARAQMINIASQLEQQYPSSNAGASVVLMSYHETVVRDVRQPLLILLASVIFVLLMACANIANLLLTRGVAREKEISVRLALGANRFRLIRQLLTESVLLALAGGVLGVGLAFLGIKLIRALVAIPNPFWAQIGIGIDKEVLGFTVVLSILAGVIFGLAPALRASNPNLSESLKESRPSSTSSLRRTGIRNLLVVTQMAMAVVLLIGAGLSIKSFLRLANVDTGYDPENLLTIYLGLSPAKYPQSLQRTNFFREVVDRVGALPGVQSSAAVSNLPLGKLPPWGLGFAVEGQTLQDSGTLPVANYRVVTLNYFKTMRMELLRGRDFDEHDTDKTHVVIVNETMANRCWPDQDPLDKRLKFVTSNKNEPWFTVVGVVEDIKDSDLDSVPTREVYVPLLQEPVGFMNLVIRTASDPLNYVGSVRQEIRAVDKDLPLYNVKSMDQVVAESYWQRHFSTTMLGVFAAVALILAFVGIYGVISYSVSQRTHEIGIRIALGAQPRNVLALVLRQGMVITIIGVIIGLICAGIVTRLMSNMLFGVSAMDLLVFVSAPLVLVLVALVSTYIPAYSATKVDPMVALREQ